MFFTSSFKHAIKMKHSIWSICFILFLQVNCNLSVPLETKLRYESNNQSDTEQNQFAKDMILNLPKENNNILDILFNIGSKYELLEAFDPVPINAGIVKLDDITVNEDNVKITYYDMIAQAIEEPSVEDEFEYNFNDKVEIKLGLKPKDLIMTGFITTSGITRNIQSGFNLTLKNPTFTLTNITTGSVNYTVEFAYEYVQIEVQSPEKYYSAVTRGLELVIKTTKSKVFAQNFDDLIQEKLVRYKKAFPFLSELLESRLNENYVILKKLTYYVGHPVSQVTLEPLLIRGLNNVIHVNIKLVREKDRMDQPLDHSLTLKFGNIEGICDWQYRNGEKELNISTSKFSIRDLTVTAAPHIYFQSSHFVRHHFFSDNGVTMTFKTTHSYSVDSQSNNDKEFSESIISHIIDHELSEYLEQSLNEKYNQQLW